MGRGFCRLDPRACSLLRQCRYVLRPFCVCALCLKLTIDVSVSGSRWSTSASPSLAHLIQRSARDVPHPTDAQKTLWDAHFDIGPYEGPVDTEFARMWDKMTSDEPRIGPLGSGSDYTVFLQRLGVRLLSYTPSGHSTHCAIAGCQLRPGLR